MSVFSHESAQRNDAGHLIDKNVFKTTRSFCYQWFHVSTLQANANRPFILSSMKRTTGGGHLQNAFIYIYIYICLKLATIMPADNQAYHDVRPSACTKSQHQKYTKALSRNHMARWVLSLKSLLFRHYTVTCPCSLVGLRCRLVLVGRDSDPLSAYKGTLECDMMTS